MIADDSTNPRKQATAPLADLDSLRPEQVYDQLVAERVRLNSYARFVVIAMMLGAALIAVHLMGVQGLNLSAIFTLSGIMALYGMMLPLLTIRGAKADHTPRRIRSLKRRLVISVLLDFIALTIAVWIVGGTRSPFLGFYLFHLAISAFLLPRRTSLMITLFSILLLHGLVFGELSGLIPINSPVGAVPSYEPLSRTYAITVIAVYTTLFVLISMSATGLVDRQRQAESESYKKSLELEELMAMRREFMLIAMHNMNSPLAVTTMLLRNLQSGALGELDPRHSEQIHRALNRLDGLDVFLADLRKLSELRRADLHEQSTEVSLEFLLVQVIDEHRDLAEERAQSITIDPQSTTGLVFGVPRLLHEALVNFVTNAIKYTPEGGRITTKISERGDQVRVEVSDTGVGLEPNDAAKVFDEFVRVDRTNPAISKTKGSGLGLSLVKQIVAAHKGTVGVDSTPGKGSTFWFEIPGCRSPDSPASTSPVSPVSPT